MPCSSQMKRQEGQQGQQGQQGPKGKGPSREAIRKRLSDNGSVQSGQGGKTGTKIFVPAWHVHLADDLLQLLLHGLDKTKRKTAPGGVAELLEALDARIHKELSRSAPPPRKVVGTRPWREWTALQKSLGCQRDRPGKAGSQVANSQPWPEWMALQKRIGLQGGRFDRGDKKDGLYSSWPEWRALQERIDQLEPPPDQGKRGQGGGEPEEGGGNLSWPDWLSALAWIRLSELALAVVHWDGSRQQVLARDIEDCDAGAYEELCCLAGSLLLCRRFGEVGAILTVLQRLQGFGGFWNDLPEGRKVTFKMLLIRVAAMRQGRVPTKHDIVEPLASTRPENNNRAKDRGYLSRLMTASKGLRELADARPSRKPKPKQVNRKRKMRNH